MNKKIYPVCVIGGGSAGIMAALRTVLNNDECLFFPGSPKDKKKSRALWVKKVENIPGLLKYDRGIEEPNNETIQWIEQSPYKNKLIHNKNTGVVTLKKIDNVFEIIDSKNQIHFANYVILCTGVMDVQPEIAGGIESIFNYANAQTVNYCLLCDGHHVLNKRVSIVGHSNSAAWAAIMLFERYSPLDMSIITHGKIPEFQKETQLLIDRYGIRIIQKTISQIQGREKGKFLDGFVFDDGQSIETDICFISLGMIVYNELAKQVGAELDERGFVKADESGLTSVRNFYVAGDLKANTKKQIYTAWDNAVNAANAINMKIRADKRP